MMRIVFWLWMFLLAVPIAAEAPAPANSDASAAASTSTTARPRQIPTADFAARAFMLSPILSPDGTMVAARLNRNDLASGSQQSIGVYTLADAKFRIVKIPDNTDLVWYRWAGNDRLLLSLGQTVPYFNDEAYATRLVLWDLKTTKLMPIAQKKGGLEGDDLLYVDPNGAWILLAMQQTVYDYPSVYRVDLSDGKLQEVVRQRSDVWEWFADRDGVVRAGIGFDTRSWSMVYRKNASEKFQKVGRAQYDDESANLELIRFAIGSDEGFALSNKDTGRYALYKFNYATKQLGELVFASPTNDVTDYSLADDGKSLKAVWYTDDRDRIVWFDPKMKEYQLEIDSAVRDQENWIQSRSKDDEKMIVWMGASNNPGRYYVFVPKAGRMYKLASLNEKLKPSELARTSYVHYKARDGLQIPAYLTLPVGRPAKGLPLIIHPHGGPFDVRDTPDYDPEVQMLANRGYAVLQPNFRGSGGYGKDFYLKGEGQWGRSMQDDLDDGMDWLVEQHIVDPKRVCIVGASYGGYAALWGATRNPERYRCAASYAGISDLHKQLKFQISFKVSRKYRKDWRKTVKGVNDFDVKTVSPLYNVDQLKVPVLLMHGDADQTVPFKQSKLYSDELQRAGKTHEFYIHSKEGHGFASNDNLKDWLDKLEAFLEKYNPAE